MAKPRTLYDKIWDEHLVHEAPDGTCLLYIDRHLVHEVTSPQAFEGLRMTGRKVRAPEKTLAVVDHNVPTTDRSKGIDDPEIRAPGRDARRERHANSASSITTSATAARASCTWSAPSRASRCPAPPSSAAISHTSTHGAFGALAHGIGTSEVEHVLATQTLIQQKAKNMRVRVDGALNDGVTAKDIILAIIGEIGTAGGTGHVIEYAGEAIEALSMEGRMTICNMSIEGGARAGLIAPDEKTFDYIKGRPRAPKAGAFEIALAPLADALFRQRTPHFDQRDRAACREAAAARHLGHQPRAGGLHLRPRAAPEEIADEIEAHRRDPLARLYGLGGRREDHRPHARPRVHRLLHQWPHRGSARGREDRRRQAASTPMSAP